MTTEEVARRAVTVYALRREINAISCEATDELDGGTCVRPFEKGEPGSLPAPPGLLPRHEDELCQACKTKAFIQKRLAAASRRLRSGIRAYVRGLVPGGSDAALEVALRGFAEQGLDR